MGRPAGLGAGGARVDPARAIGSRRRRRRGRSTCASTRRCRRKRSTAPRRAAAARALSGAEPPAIRRARRSRDRGRARRRAAAADHDRPRVERSRRFRAARARSPSASARACSPTSRPARAFPRGIRCIRSRRASTSRGEAGALIRDADVILSLDWIDLGGIAAPGLRRRSWPQAKVIQCSLDSVHATTAGAWTTRRCRRPTSCDARRAGPARAARCSRRSGPAHPASAARRRRRRSRRTSAGRRPPSPATTTGCRIADWRGHDGRARRASTLVHPPAARLAGRVLPLRASARLHRLRRRRRHRLRPRHGRRRGARAARRATGCRSRCSATATT